MAPRASAAPRRWAVPAAIPLVLSLGLAIGGASGDEPEEAVSPSTGGDSAFTEAERSWWAIQPVTRPTPPGREDAPHPIDAFVRESLGEHGLAPAEPAPPRILLRRVAFDLTGLPPSPGEIDAVLTDARRHEATGAPAAEAFDAAYATFVDRLLDSPRYGEHWAQFWLDLVRYADSDGYRADAYRPNAWPYRDWVIRSLNEDKPFDRFVREQLAGDELWPGDPDALAATGFLRHGVYEYNNRDAAGQWELILNELTDTVGDAFLGLGMACARCHDHKFDPIRQGDYFRLRAFFEPILWRDDLPLADRAERERHAAAEAAWRAEAGEALEALQAFEAPFRARKEAEAVERFPGDVQAAYRKPDARKSPRDHQIADLVRRQVLWEYTLLDKGMSESEKARWEELKEAVAAFDARRPEPLQPAFAATDLGPEAPPTSIPGAPDAGPVPPGLLEILDPSPIATIPPADGSGRTTGRRAALAAWITSPDNPVTTRVIVNRIWGWHFGTGIVATPSDFGHLGEPPSHPRLLDWLVGEFLDHGWRLKPLHRLIVTSATYRQASRVAMPTEAAMTDPGNRLLWRFPARRLAAEPIRDAMLAVSGELRHPGGGPGREADAPVRSIFTRRMRNDPDPLLESFDAPANFASRAGRNTTTTATQSLLMINGGWTHARARHFATRLLGTHGDDRTAAVEDAFRHALGRDPDPVERESALAFLEGQAALLESARESASPASLALEPFPDFPEQGMALRIDESPESPIVRLADDAREFSDPSPARLDVEAIVRLESLYPDATVRTIAARWNGDPASSGWSVGITSTRSRYEPNHLILQLVGERPATAGGSPGPAALHYQVAASGLKVPLGKACLVSVTVDFTTREARFTVRDLAAGTEAPADTSSVDLEVARLDVPVDRPVTIGGRSGSRHPSRWHGWIDDLRVAEGGGPGSRPEDGVVAAAVWRFETAPAGEGSGIAVGGLPPDVASVGVAGLPRLEAIPADHSDGPEDPARAALLDFCHALLTSSEFLHID